MRTNRSCVHYVDDDGIILCQGVDLENAARAVDPPVVTVHYCDVTCGQCRTWFMRTQLAS